MIYDDINFKNREVKRKMYIINYTKSVINQNNDFFSHKIDGRLKESWVIDTGNIITLARVEIPTRMK